MSVRAAQCSAVQCACHVTWRVVSSPSRRPPSASPPFAFAFVRSFLRSFVRLLYERLGPPRGEHALCNRHTLRLHQCYKCSGTATRSTGRLAPAASALPPRRRRNQEATQQRVCQLPTKLAICTRRESGSSRTTDGLWDFDVRSAPPTKTTDPRN